MAGLKLVHELSPTWPQNVAITKGSAQLEPATCLGPPRQPNAPILLDQVARLGSKLELDRSFESTVPATGSNTEIIGEVTQHRPNVGPPTVSKLNARLLPLALCQVAPDHAAIAMSSGAMQSG